MSFLETLVISKKWSSVNGVDTLGIVFCLQQ